MSVMCIGHLGYVKKDRHGGFGRDSWYLHVIVYPLKAFIHI